MVDATPDFTCPIGQFCAEIEDRLPKEQKALVPMFYQRLNRAGLRVAKRSQFQSEWETFFISARA